MTLQEFYNFALKLGATPQSEVVVEYCNIHAMRIEKDGNNKKIFIN